MHLRDLTHPGFLVGLALYALYYFVVNFSNYLFPQYTERGLGLPLLTTGWLNSFSAGISLVVAVFYIRYAARVTNKRAMIMTGCIAMATAAWWLSMLPPDAPLTAGPVEVVEAHGVAEVPGALDRIEAGLASGLHAAGFRMGPFELLDLTGLDVSSKVMSSIYEQFWHELRFRPSALVAPRVAAGLFGRKTGQGWYVYDGDRPRRPQPRPVPPLPARPKLWIDPAASGHD